MCTCSPLPSGELGCRPRSRVVASRDDSGRPLLAREGVVRRPSASTDTTTSRPPMVRQSASAASLQPLPPRRPHAEPSHVETQATLPKVGFFEKGCWLVVRVSQSLRVVPVPVEVADLLWLVSWNERCFSQRHCSSSRGFSNSLTPRQGIVHFCA